MGKICEFKKREVEKKIRPVNMPDVKHDRKKDKAFYDECIHEGYALQVCPSCGTFLGGINPYCASYFECGVCGARWICENAEELFDEAYPNAGKEQ